MKRLVAVFSIIMLTSILSYSQFVYSPDDTCIPDTAFAHEEGNIYPEAYHPTLNPDGGVLDSACINEDYSFVFTAVVPDSIPFSGTVIKLDWMTIEENGVLDIPAGVSYKCNPPNCNFVSGTLGCLELFGKPVASNSLGVYDLKLKTKISVADGLIVINDTLPQMLLDSAHYFLPLFEEGSQYCQPTSIVNNFINYRVTISPNPVFDRLSFEVELPSSGVLNYSLFDLKGSLLFKREKRLSSNVNIISEEISDINAGIYFLKTDYNGVILTRKVIVF